ASKAQNGIPPPNTCYSCAVTVQPQVGLCLPPFGGAGFILGYSAEESSTREADVRVHRMDSPAAAALTERTLAGTFDPQPPLRPTIIISTGGASRRGANSTLKAGLRPSPHLTYPL